MSTKYQSLPVKYGSGPGVGKDFYYDIPKTVSDAKKQGWTKEERPANQHLPTLELYCPNPSVLCALYEPDTGNAAGLQIGVSCTLNIDYKKKNLQHHGLPW